MTALLFWLVAGMTGFSAIMVLMTQNIVRAAAWLLFTLAGVSMVYFLLAADFVAATQLIVYVGGTLVLVVFGVMLTAQGPFVSMKAGAGEWAIGILVGLMFFAVLAATTSLGGWQTQLPGEQDAALSNTTLQLGESFLGMTDATPQGAMTGIPPQPANTPPISRKQVAYLLPFEIVSVHLLVVLIGAAYLARAKRRRHSSPSPPIQERGGGVA